MERGVRAEHVRHAGQQPAQHVEQPQRGWHVQRGEVGDRIQLAPQPVVDDHRPGHQVTAVHETVPDGGRCRVRRDEVLDGADARGRAGRIGAVEACADGLVLPDGDQVQAVRAPVDGQYVTHAAVLAAPPARKRRFRGYSGFDDDVGRRHER
jgi:hypothetical protein